jgi:hypothetical protein
MLNKKKKGFTTTPIKKCLDFWHPSKGAQSHPIA